LGVTESAFIGSWTSCERPASEGALSTRLPPTQGRAVEDFAVLPTENAPIAEVGEYLAGFLADISSARDVATPEEENRLARQLFNGVLIENRTAVEVTPRPDLLPFFVSVSDLNTYGRKRRGLLSQQTPSAWLHSCSRPALQTRRNAERGICFAEATCHEAFSRAVI
jgi:hypothetical protein